MYDENPIPFSPMSPNYVTNPKPIELQKPTNVRTASYGGTIIINQVFTGAQTIIFDIPIQFKHYLLVLVYAKTTGLTGSMFYNLDDLPQMMLHNNGLLGVVKDDIDYIDTNRQVHKLKCTSGDDCWLYGEFW